MSADAVIRAAGLRKRFGDLLVLDGIDLSVQQGERIAVLGSSGSGKSTLLRCLNFMELPSEGRIHFGGRPIGSEVRRRGRIEVEYREGDLAALRRRVGMVFQQFNLFPHMTALENVMEGPLTVLGHARAQARETGRAYLAKVGLADKGDEYPARLSGGQQQRVAIARALAMEPEVLLFDEPTSSLDPELVVEVLRVIKELAEEGRTMLLVTHELGFAYHFASRVIFLHDGRILEEGPPEVMLKEPKEERLRSFLARFTEFAF